MLWAAQAAVPPYNIRNDMSAGALTVMAIVIVISLAALLIPVNLAGRASRSPQQRSPVREVRRPVTGGTHLGDPRSVAPSRDEPAGPVEPAGPAGPASPGSGGDER